MMNCFKSYNFTYKYETTEDLKYIEKEIWELRRNYRKYYPHYMNDEIKKVYHFWFHVNEEDYKIKDTLDKEVLCNIINKNYYKKWMIACNGAEDLAMAEQEINVMKDKYGSFFNAEKIMRNNDVVGYAMTLGER